MRFCVNKNPFSIKSRSKERLFLLLFFHYDDEKNETAII